MYKNVDSSYKFMSTMQPMKPNPIAVNGMNVIGMNNVNHRIPGYEIDEAAFKVSNCTSPTTVEEVNTATTLNRDKWL